MAGRSGGWVATSVAEERVAGWLDDLLAGGIEYRGAWVEAWIEHTITKQYPDHDRKLVHPMQDIISPITKQFPTNYKTASHYKTMTQPL